MALREQRAEEQAGIEGEPRGMSKGESAFRGHLVVYLVTGCFLLTLNLLTSPGDLWFYWPLFFWGWALVFQAVATFGAQAPARTMEALRAIIPGLANATAPSAPSAAPPSTAPAPRRASRANSAPFAATAFAAVHERIEELREIVRQIPEGQVRVQADRICAAADRIVAVMAADRASEELVSWFDSQLLTPTTSLLGGYVRLAGRGVAGAEETLRRVEEQNLPLLESRFDALYAQLHRGEIIDLAVASEMLELDPPELPTGSHSPRGNYQIQT
jgi:hypothetical protein